MYTDKNRRRTQHVRVQQCGQLSWVYLWGDYLYLRKVYGSVGNREKQSSTAYPLSLHETAGKAVFYQEKALGAKPEKTINDARSYLSTTLWRVGTSWIKLYTQSHNNTHTQWWKPASSSSPSNSQPVCHSTSTELELRHS